MRYYRWRFVLIGSLVLALFCFLFVVSVAREYFGMQDISIISQGRCTADELSFPTPRDFALMSQIAYDYPNYRDIKGWRVFNATDATGVSDETGYFGVALINDACNIVVVAHRGTEPDINNIIPDSISDLYLALEMVPPQFVFSAIEFIDNSYSLAQEHFQLNSDNYRIYHTGHSLGAALAELSAVWTGDPAITFESPGTAPIVDNISSILLDFVTHVVDIKTYVGPPNIINTANEQIGDIILVDPNWKELRDNYYDPEDIFPFENYWGYLQEAHSLQRMIDGLFDAKTGQPIPGSIDDIDELWPNGTGVALLHFLAPNSLPPTREEADDVSTASIAAIIALQFGSGFDVPDVSPDLALTVFIGETVGGASYHNNVLHTVMSEMPPCLFLQTFNQPFAGERVVANALTCQEAWSDISDRMYDEAEAAIEEWNQVAAGEGLGEVSIVPLGEFTVGGLDLINIISNMIIRGAIRAADFQQVTTDTMVAITNAWIAEIGYQEARANYLELVEIYGDEGIATDTPAPPMPIPTTKTTIPPTPTLNVSGQETLSSPVTAVECDSTAELNPALWQSSAATDWCLNNEDILIARRNGAWILTQETGLADYSVVVDFFSERETASAADYYILLNTQAASGGIALRLSTNGRTLTAAGLYRFAFAQMVEGDGLSGKSLETIRTMQVDVPIDNRFHIEVQIHRRRRIIATVNDVVVLDETLAETPLPGRVGLQMPQGSQIENILIAR